MGVTHGKSTKQKAKHIQKVERQARAVDMGLSGLPMGAIAAREGVSLTTIAKDYQQTLAAAEKRRTTLGRRLFHEHLNQVEQHIADLEARRATLGTRADADPGNLSALLSVDSQLLRWYQERAKLLNLYPNPQADSPTRQEITVYQLNWNSPTDPTDPTDRSAPSFGTIPGSARRPSTPGDDDGQQEDAETDADQASA